MALLSTMTDMAYFIHVFIEKVEKHTESMPTKTHDFILRMTESYPREFAELCIGTTYLNFKIHLCRQPIVKLSIIFREWTVKCPLLFV